MEKLIGTSKNDGYHEKRLYQDVDYTGENIYRGVVETDRHIWDVEFEYDRDRALRWLSK